MMAMMLAKGRGAKRVIGVDMLPDRLATAKQLGVMDNGFLATTENLPALIAELTHGGADVALDCSRQCRRAFAGITVYGGLGKSGVHRRNREG
jgi:threonine dehydrogenase-like Zn-dependent dehydrogenase